MNSKAGLRVYMLYVCLFTTLVQAQVTSPPSAADGVAQFDGKFRPSSNKGVDEAYLPKLFRISHAANLVKLQNGNLLCFWFSGTGEGESKVAIVMSRLVKASDQWSETVEVDHQEGRSFQNPVAFQTSSGRLWLLHTSQPAREGQTNAEVLFLTSDDAGLIWTAPQPLFTQSGSFIRHPPVLITRNDWLLPMYYTPTRNITDGAESHYSAVKITNDGGKSWKECKVPQSNGLVQQSVVRLPNGHFLGFLRSRYADFVYKNTSADGCKWTAPTATHLPNNNSSIQVTMLADGSLALAFNNSSAGVTRDKTTTSARQPLSIALSRDGGETWPWVRDIETGSSSGGHEEYSYPSLLQDENGKLNVAFSYRRETIKVVRFEQEWIGNGSTQGKFKGDGVK